jgi:hypothetical protein
MAGRSKPEPQTGSGRESALGGVPQAEVADLVQAFGQNVLHEPTDELFTRDPAGAPAVGFALLVAERHGLVVEADNSVIGDGHAEDVAGQVIQDRLLTFTPGGAVDNPGLRPRRRGQDQVGTSLLERGPELAAHELGQGLDRDAEVLARRMPRVAVVGDAAARDQAMDMGVIEQLRGPGMQHREHADGGADETGIAGEFDDRLGGRLHEQGVTACVNELWVLRSFLCTS